MSIIYVYNDQGVSAEALEHTIYTLETFAASVINKNNNKKNLKIIIKTINAADIKSGFWQSKATLLIMPGGADILYVKKLNGAGNAAIKNYVENGGAYLGICAGAYYGSAFIEFDAGGSLEVIGARELKFFPGKARGPLLAKYDYKSNSGARAASVNISITNLDIKRAEIIHEKNINLFFNGGPYFENASSFPNVSILGYYNHSPQLKENEGKNQEEFQEFKEEFKANFPAIIYISYGKGKVILSGLHFEYSEELLAKRALSDGFLKSILPVLQYSARERQNLANILLELLLSNYFSHN